MRNLVQVPVGLGSVEAASGPVRIESLGDGVRLVVGMVLGYPHRASDNLGLRNPPPTSETPETVDGILVERETRPVLCDLHTIMICCKQCAVKPIDLRGGCYVRSTLGCSSSGSGSEGSGCGEPFSVTIRMGKGAVASPV